MEKLKSFIFQDYIQELLKKFGLLLILMSLTRIIFFLFHYPKFQSATLTDFFIGIWFDIITISLVFLPYLLVYLLPVWNRNNKFYRFFFNLAFYLVSLILIAANLVDVEYFKYTGKRSTIDLFSILSAGSDLKQLVGSFLRDFWYLLLFFIIFAFILYRLLKKITSHPKKKWPFLNGLVAFLFYIPFFILFARGGFVHRPVGIIEASNYTKVENTALVLNTTFTLIKSKSGTALDLKEYMSDEKSIELYNPIRTSHPQNIFPKNTNVVIIMLESFGIEFSEVYTGNETYMPFLDSLLKESWYFQNGFANGKKSIEALPTIISSMPSLMDDPYISSNYSNNKLKSLVQILGDFGYESAFYHGATNGSMRFDAFTSSAGFNHYFGRKEYDNDKHFDQTWGILDEYFNPWSAKSMSSLKEPFISVLFTLSSHHPFYIPPHMRSKVKKGNQPLCASINYGDISLAKFFETAKKQSWYKNTVFVICADHSPGSETGLYSARHIIYRIPIAIYAPNGEIAAKIDMRIFQQADIFPTILDLLNIKTKYYSFGKSIFEPGKRSALAYLGGTYHYFEDEYMLNFSNDQLRNLYKFDEFVDYPDELLTNDKNLTKEISTSLKAIIQRYNRDLIQNKTNVK